MYYLLLQKLCFTKGFSQGLSDLMINPVQRIARYSLLLKDVEKAYKKSGNDEFHSEIEATLDIATDIANYVNDMMMAGRIDKFRVRNYIVNLRRKNYY